MEVFDAIIVGEGQAGMPLAAKLADVGGRVLLCEERRSEVRASRVTVRPEMHLLPLRDEALLNQIQQTLHDRARFGPIWEYIWPSGIGPRVAEPALMLINPYPWSAPLEEVRLKAK